MDQTTTDNVIAFPANRRVRPVEHTDDDRYYIEVSGRWWSRVEWDDYEAHLRESFGLKTL